MILAVASGKGGTGKTTVSTALALSSSRPVDFLDCDVEEPNAHLFLKPSKMKETDVNLPVPFIDVKKCTGCRKCAEICQFKAIIVIGNRAMIFQELCHSCGGCNLVCPTQAIEEKPFCVGKIRESQMNGIHFVQGELKIGQAMSPPVIRAVKKYGERNRLAIIDAPPGNACPMVNAIKGSDYVILVTEPTPFGLNDLTLAVNIVRGMKIPFGIIINRDGSGDHRVEEYAKKERLDILLKIPDSRKVAEAYSKGRGIIEVLPELRVKLGEVLDHLILRMEK